MAKRVKMPKRPKSSRSKEEFEYLVSEYLRVFEKAQPGLTSQAHDFIPGQAWTPQQAIEVAHHLMRMALGS